MNIKNIMSKYHLTQAELAERLGMNRVSVSRLLSDKNDMRISTIKKLANAIGCNITDFFADEIEPDTSIVAYIHHGTCDFTCKTFAELHDFLLERTPDVYAHWAASEDATELNNARLRNEISDSLIRKSIEEFNRRQNEK